MLTITRTIDAPPEAVFNAWIDAAQLARWLAPGAIAAEIERLEAHVGHLLAPDMLGFDLNIR